jgi:hypothetical protein
MAVFIADNRLKPCFVEIVEITADHDFGEGTALPGAPLDSCRLDAKGFSILKAI